MSELSIREKIMKLNTDRVNLRPQLPKDQGFFGEYYQIPKIQQFTLLQFSSQEDIVIFYNHYNDYDNGPQFRIIVEEKINHQQIGTVCFLNWSKTHRFAEIGYDLHPDFWGKGLMTEVLQCLIPFAFNELNLNRIEATINPENKRSINLLTRLGFRKEGIFREKYYNQGKFQDEIAFALLKSEFSDN